MLLAIEFGYQRKRRVSSRDDTVGVLSTSGNGRELLVVPHKYVAVNPSTRINPRRTPLHTGCAAETVSASTSAFRGHGPATRHGCRSDHFPTGGNAVDVTASAIADNAPR